MDIEKLKELREETEQYRAVADDRCMSTNYEDDLLELIDEALQAYQPWVNVEDRLPEDAALVLIYPVDDEAASAQYWQQSNHFRMWDYCVKPGDVTHWMPLPESPKGE